MGYVPAGEAIVAVVIRLGDPVTTDSCVSPFTNPVIVLVNAGFAVP